MRHRPALVLAAPAGVLGGHAIGYLVAPGPAGAAAVHHGYLALVLSAAVPLAVIALTWSVVRGASPAHPGRPGPSRPKPSRPSPTRPGPTRTGPLGPLVVAQWVLFTGQEAVEHALAGHGPAAAFHSPALWFGLAAQVVTALAVVLLLRASAVTGARLLSLLAPRLPAVLPLALRVPARPSGRPSTSPAASCPSRGPPAARFA